MLSFYEWKNQFAYTGSGVSDSSEGTMEEAMLVFFYEGVSPWIKSYGYKWVREESFIADKFVYFCYMIDTTSNMYDTDIKKPKPRHRNLEEDRETFDLLIDTIELIDFLSNWEFRTEVVGTRFDYLIREFCYTWIDVSSGKPGGYTQSILDTQAEAQAEEEMISGPDTTSRKKWDLY